MRCIHLKNNDPFFCLATEEFLLKNSEEDVFMLWQSTDTIVVGKHQVALAEINYTYVRESNTTIARRISGGGTVFHDEGNVNFAFIKTVKSTSEISFKQFTRPVVDSLAKLNITAIPSGRSDLLVNGLKISGNAEHIYKSRVLHHGTLLFNSDLEKLGNAIRVSPGKYHTKAVQSNRSGVTNISNFLKQKMDCTEFVAFLMEDQLSKPGNSSFNLNIKEKESILKLSEEKFGTWEWRFGYSPKYIFKNHIQYNGKTISVELNVIRGIIIDSLISGNYFLPDEAKNIALAIRDKRHIYENIHGIFSTLHHDIPNHVIAGFF